MRTYFPTAPVHNGDAVPEDHSDVIYPELARDFAVIRHTQNQNVGFFPDFKGACRVTTAHGMRGIHSRCRDCGFDRKTFADDGERDRHLHAETGRLDGVVTGGERDCAARIDHTRQTGTVLSLKLPPGREHRDDAGFGQDRSIGRSDLVQATDGHGVAPV
jgi:hypothetical protein